MRPRVWHPRFVSPSSAVPEAPALLCQGKRTKDPTGNLPGAAASAASAPAGVLRVGWDIARPRAACKSWARAALHLDELRCELLKVYNEEQTNNKTQNQKKNPTPNYLESPAAAPQQTFLCRKKKTKPTDPIHFPGRG